MTEHPSQGAIHDGAMELIAAGNTFESVAGVLGVPIDTLREWATRPAAVRPSHDANTTANDRPWLRFPGTVVYPTGSNWMIIAVGLLAMVVCIPAAGWPLVFRPHPRPFLIAASASVATAFLAAAIQAIRAAKVNRFEMRPDAIARYTLAGCSVLGYADIIGLKAVMGKGFYFIEFLTRTAKPMTIHPSFSQLEEDERLWA